MRTRAATMVWLVAAAAAGCGIAPSSNPGASLDAASLGPGLGAWQSAEVLTPDSAAFRAGAASRGIVIGDRTTWVETDAGGWLPAEPFHKRERSGLVEWRGSLVSWAEGGHIQTSRDGLTWTDARTGPGDSNPAAVVPFANQLVLLGEGTLDPVDAWRSVDASSWSAIEDAPAGMVAAAVVPGHGLVAVGSSAEAGAVWSTTDAVTWQRMPGPPPGATLSAFRGITEGPAGTVAIGAIDEAEATWWTADFTTWTRAPIVTGQDAFLSSVAFVRGTYVIPGQRAERPTVWLSVDGRSWTAVDLPVPAGAAGVAAVARAVDDRIVVFGYTLQKAGNGSPFRASDLVWTLDPTN